MLKRIWSLVIKEFIHLRSDWWLPAFMLIGGASELLAVAWATSRPITNLPLMVFDQSQNSGKPRHDHWAGKHQNICAPEQVNDMQTIQNAMDRGQISAALVIPPDYAEQLQSPIGKPTLLMIFNGSESSPAQAANRAVQGLARDIDQRILIRRLGLKSCPTERI